MQRAELPERVATIPPLITPIRDASGEIRDATAEQVSSLDVYMQAVERESAPSTVTPPS